MNTNPYTGSYERPLQPPAVDYGLPSQSTPMTAPAVSNSAHLKSVPPQPPQPQPQQEKFESAIDFLERVKKVYANQTSVYNTFLDIMKGFKTQSIDTPGVISRVQQLFSARPDLINGFSSFLPKEYKVEPAILDESKPTRHSSFPIPPTSQTQNSNLILQPNSFQSSPPSPQPSLMITCQPFSPTLLPTPPLSNLSPRPLPAQLGEECARLYVKKIKARFNTQPHVYKTFLDILHTFHKERHTIAHVSQQVAILFKDHSDLLSEFERFLPDPLTQTGDSILGVSNLNQPQIRQKISTHFPSQTNQKKISNISNSRLSFSNPPPPIPTSSQNNIPSQSPNNRTSNTPSSLPTNNLRPTHSPQSTLLNPLSTRLPPNPHPSHPTSINDISPSNSNPFAKPIHYDPSIIKDGSHGTFQELIHFFQIRHILPVIDYAQFLKLLSMYNVDALSKQELYTLIRELLLPHSETLLDWIRRFLQISNQSGKEQYESPTTLHHHHHHPSTPSTVISDPSLSLGTPFKDDTPLRCLSDYDWTSSEKLGPSYRAIPKAWTSWSCSGRIGNDHICNALNDEWISVPMGSEDGSFKSTRKNQYEELLFKCEDDRYELDLVLENYKGTILSLEQLWQHIKCLTHHERLHYQLKHDTLDSSTLRTIKKIYDYRGEDVLRLLHSKPTIAVGVILSRLQQKHTEWKLACREWHTIWNKISHPLYYKSLDHLSTIFKQEEKRILGTKQLVQELKQLNNKDIIRGESGIQEDSEIEKGTSLRSIQDIWIWIWILAGYWLDISGYSKSSLGISSHSKSGLDIPIIHFISFSSITSSSSLQSLLTLILHLVPTSPTHANPSFSPPLTFTLNPDFFADIYILLHRTMSHHFPKFDMNLLRVFYYSFIVPFFHVDEYIPSSLLMDPIEEESASKWLEKCPQRSKAIETTMSMLCTAFPSQTIDKTIYNSIDENTIHSLGDTTMIPNQKPIHTRLTTLKASHEMLFLGNEHFYILFRYLQLCIDRLGLASNLAKASVSKRHLPLINVETEINYHLHQEQQSHQDGQEIKQENGPQNEQLKPSLESTTIPIDPDQLAKTRYTFFLSRLSQHIHGAISQSQFEDECRQLLTVESYPLFTLDKLLYLLSKHIQIALTEHQQYLFLQLFAYEANRHPRFVDSVYANNYRQLMTPQQQDLPHQSSNLPIAITTEVEHDRMINLSFSFVDSFSTPITPWPPHPSPVNQYINHYLHWTASIDKESDQITRNTTKSKSNSIDPQKEAITTSQLSLPYLPRCLRVKSKSNTKSNESTNRPAVNCIRHALGMRILADQNYKLRFVGGTEDFWMQSTSNRKSLGMKRPPPLSLDHMTLKVFKIPMNEDGDGIHSKVGDINHSLMTFNQPTIANPTEMDSRKVNLKMVVEDKRGVQSQPHLSISVDQKKSNTDSSMGLSLDQMEVTRNHTALVIQPTSSAS